MFVLLQVNRIIFSKFWNFALVAQTHKRRPNKASPFKITCKLHKGYSSIDSPNKPRPPLDNILAQNRIKYPTATASLISPTGSIC